MGNLSHYTGSSNVGGPLTSGPNNPGSPGDTPDHGIAAAAAGYASEDFVPGSSSSRERKKGWFELCEVTNLIMFQISLIMI
jgi:hypothetical protein